MKKSILMTAAITVLLTGCAQRELKGTGSKAIVVGPASPEGDSPAKGPLSKVEGKAFYMFKPGFTCVGPMPGSAPLASWLDKVEVVEGRIIRWGTRCNGEGLPLSPAEESSVKLGADGLTLTIAGKLYHRSAQPEKAAENPK